MDVSFIKVPQNIAHTSSAMPLQFDQNPITLPSPPIKMGDSSINSGGILDGQWSCLPSYLLNNSSDSMNSNNNNTAATTTNQDYCFVSAHSTGEIQLHSMRVIPSDEYLEVSSHDTHHQLVDIQFLGRSNYSYNMTNTNPTAIGSTAPNPFCLSLRWDTSDPFLSCTTNQNDLSTTTTTTTTTPHQIVSSYSNGTMAIHDVVSVSANLDHTSAGGSPQQQRIMKNVQLIERDRWGAHTMFPTDTPAEVWTAAFVHSDGGKKKNLTTNHQIVWSGGDDMKLKIWDTRSTLRPMLCFHSLFDAGITCISPHPKQNHIVAVGSCTCVSFCIFFSSFSL
jgi:hypothetical protein